MYSLRSIFWFGIEIGFFVVGDKRFVWENISKCVLVCVFKDNGIWIVIWFLLKFVLNFL